MTLQLLALSGDNVFLLLLLIAVLAFVLGIGLPTVSVYILTATLLAPALVKLGVTPMAAHMFVMYNGMLSMITPPVAFAAYAAANIARTDGWTTGWIACLVGWSTFILPFLFVLTPSLLMDGSLDQIVLELRPRTVRHLFVGTTAGIVGFALGAAGDADGAVALRARQSLRDRAAARNASPGAICDQLPIGHRGARSRCLTLDWHSRRKQGNDHAEVGSANRPTLELAAQWPSRQMPSASCAGRSEIENSTASSLGVVRVALPRRHHEHVVDAPFESALPSTWSCPCPRRQTKMVPSVER